MSLVLLYKIVLCNKFKELLASQFLSACLAAGRSFLICECKSTAEFLSSQTFLGLFLNYFSTSGANRVIFKGLLVVYFLWDFFRIDGRNRFIGLFGTTLGLVAA